MIMWHIREHRSVHKACEKLPLQVLGKYELWKNLIFRHGPDILKQFPGFKDEKLIGDPIGQRSSRLNLKYRVLYVANPDTLTLFVLEITAHDY